MKLSILMLIGGGDPHGPSCICMHVSHDHSRGKQLTRTSLPRILISSIHVTMPCHAMHYLSLSLTCECCVIDSLVDGQDIKKVNYDGDREEDSTYFQMLFIFNRFPFLIMHDAYMLLFPCI